jgi:hypothetical protein
LGDVVAGADEEQPQRSLGGHAALGEELPDE